MSPSATLPLVVICGRPNVGKSTLFNRLVGKARAIVDNEAGITRDRFEQVVTWGERSFRLADTGGIVIGPTDTVTRKAQEQAQRALREAAVILFVVDGQAALTRTDYELRDTLLRYDKPILLVVNKMDNERLAENRYDFFELGVGEPYAVSATHNLGISELMAAVLKVLPESEPQPAAEESWEHKPCRVAIVGKPNVGKSSFINALLNEERVIVDDTPGTTRDAIDIPFAWEGRPYVLVDTAGMRHKAGIRTPVEFYSVARSLRAMRNADVACVLVDSTEGITDQDKRILQYGIDQGVGLILVYTKWDLVEDKAKRARALEAERDFKIPHWSFIPSVTISAAKRQRLFDVLRRVNHVMSAAHLRIPTAQVNRFFEALTLEYPPPIQRGKAAKILYATQTSVQPTVFVLFVNQKRLFHFSYVRFLEKRLREKYDFEGVPIKIELREERRAPHT